MSKRTDFENVFDILSRKAFRVDFGALRVPSHDIPGARGQPPASSQDVAEVLIILNPRPFASIHHRFSSFFAPN